MGVGTRIKVLMEIRLGKERKSETQFVYERAHGPTTFASSVLYLYRPEGKYKRRQLGSFIRFTIKLMPHSFHMWPP